MNFKKICLTKNPEILVFSAGETEIYNDQVFNKIITRNPITNEIKIYDPNNKTKLKKSESKKLGFNDDINVSLMHSGVVNTTSKNFKDKIEIREVSNGQVLIFKEKVQRKLGDRWTIEDINGNQYSKTIKKNQNTKPEVYAIDGKLYKIGADIGDRLGDDEDSTLKYLEQLVFGEKEGNIIPFMEDTIDSGVRDMYLYPFNDKLFYFYSGYGGGGMGIIDSKGNKVREGLKIDLTRSYISGAYFSNILGFEIGGHPFIRIVGNNTDKDKLREGLMGIINQQGKYIIPLEYNRLTLSSDGIFIGQKVSQNADGDNVIANYIIELEDDLTGIKNIEPIEFLDKNNLPIEFKIFPDTTIINGLITTKNSHGDRIVLDIKMKREFVPPLLDTYLEESTLLKDGTTIWMSGLIGSPNFRSEYIGLPNGENLLDIGDSQKLNLQFSGYIDELDKISKLSVQKGYIVGKMGKISRSQELDAKGILIKTEGCFSQLGEVTKGNLTFIEINGNLYDANNFAFGNISKRKIVSMPGDTNIEINGKKFKKKLLKLN